MPAESPFLGQSSVLVAVASLAGDVLELEVDPNTTVSVLKCTISEHWDLNPVELDLLHGTTIMRNDDQLERFVVCGHQLHLTCIRNIRMFEDLKSAEAHIRVAAIKSFVQVAQDPSMRGRATIVDALKPCVTDPIEEVRRSAVEAIAEVGNQDDQGILSLFIESLSNDNSEEVRCSVVAALGKLATRGDDGVVAAIHQLQPSNRRSDKDLRFVMVETLAKVSNVGDQVAIDYMARRLGDGSKSVRRAAIEALAQLSLVGDERSIQLLIGRLDDWDKSVKEVATEALSNVAPFAHEASIVALSKSLSAEELLVRRGAIRALEQLAPKRTEVVLKALRDCMECQCCEPIREDATRAWETFA
jgi:HEAT repeat protein